RARLLLQGGPPAQVASAVRLLYVGEAPYDGTMPGSLMEHLPRYLIDGVEREMELTLQLDSQGDPAACNMYRLASYNNNNNNFQHQQQHQHVQQQQPHAAVQQQSHQQQQPPPVTRAAAAQAAQTYVSVRVAPVLSAVSTAARVVAALHTHHTKVVLPGVSSVPSEVS
ncbi:hypothetical protein Agub_g9838, partial [Astrephomene gubernaculifera]